MKNTRLIALAAALITNASAKAAGYGTSFGEYGAATSLSGQSGGTGIFWDTNNYAPGSDTVPGTADDLGQSDYVGVVPGYSATVEDYWVLLGGATGIAPVTVVSYLFRPGGLAGATTASFSVRFAVLSSQTPRAAKDTFGWTFRDAAGLPLFSIRFIPHPTPTLLTVRVSNASGAEIAGSGTQNISYNSNYTLHIALSANNLLTVTVGDSLGNAPVRIVSSQPLGNPDGTTPVAGLINDVSATWAVTDATRASDQYVNYGSNSMLFDNYMLTLSPVPLPVTYSDWVTQRFSGNPNANSSPNADPDNDLVINRIEFANLTNPFVGGGSPLEIRSIASGQPGIEFLWNSHASDLNYQLVGGSSLTGAASWPSVSFEVVRQQFLGDVWRITLRPVGITGTKYFFSLRINQASP